MQYIVTAADSNGTQTVTDIFPTEPTGYTSPMAVYPVDDTVQVGIFWTTTDGVTFTPAPVSIYTAQYEADIDGILEAFASQRYNDLMHAISYENSTNPTWQAEAQYVIQSRDQMFETLYSIMDAATPDAVPTWEDVQAQLPTLAWPD